MINIFVDNLFQNVVQKYAIKHEALAAAPRLANSSMTGMAIEEHSRTRRSDLTALPEIATAVSSPSCALPSQTSLGRAPGT
jgi:hypothetical protein